MRRGSLSRIIADTLEAKQPASSENLLVSSELNMRDSEARGEIVALFWRKLNW